MISRSISSARSLAKKLSVKNYSDNLKDIPPTSDLIILALPDDQIEKVSAKISKLKINFEGKTFIHLSGSENIDALYALRQKGASTGSVHIMQTFPSKKIVSIKNCFAAIESDNSKTEKLLFSVAKSVALKPFKIYSEQKSLYHLSGVFAANFLTGNFYSADTVFKQTNSDMSSYKLLGPIAEKTLANVEKYGVSKSLSGPVERGDLNTIEKHLRDLRSVSIKSANKNLLKLINLSYLVQSLILVQVAENKTGKLSSSQKKIKTLLQTQIKKIKF